MRSESYLGKDLAVLRGPMDVVSSEWRVRNPITRRLLERGGDCVAFGGLLIVLVLSRGSEPRCMRVSPYFCCRRSPFHDLAVLSVSG